MITNQIFIVYTGKGLPAADAESDATVTATAKPASENQWSAKMHSATGIVDREGKLVSSRLTKGARDKRDFNAGNEDSKNTTAIHGNPDIVSGRKGALNWLVRTC